MGKAKKLAAGTETGRVVRSVRVQKNGGLSIVSPWEKEDRIPESKDFRVGQMVVIEGEEIPAPVRYVNNNACNLGISRNGLPAVVSFFAIAGIVVS